MLQTGRVRRLAAEDSGGLQGDSIDVAGLCAAHGWTRARLIKALRNVAALEGRELPSDDSLKRMIRLWVNGTRRPSEDYAGLLARAFGISQVQAGIESTEDFFDLMERADSTVDADLVTALEAQTQSLRELDRRLGAHRLLAQAEGHARNAADLVQWAPLGKIRRQLAATGAEAAALAGWQALDLGRPKTAWKLHALGRALAQESDDASVIAHVTAQQAYALLDVGRAEQSVSHVVAARAAAGTTVPGVVRAWLAAAEAETRAATGDSAGAVRMLDHAEDLHSSDTHLPFIFLDAAHLARWRGHCLARLGHPDAMPVLSHALDVLDPGFHRAAAGLHADLATAHRLSGDYDASCHHARLAVRLSDRTGSHRQRARVTALLHPESKEVEQRD